MTRKAHSIQMLEEAITSMGFVLSSIDIRRLHFFTRDTATRTATVKALRNAVAQFRIDPLKLLEHRGVGIKTLHSVQILSDLIASQETKKEFGVDDNLAAVQTILRTTHRGVSDDVRKFISIAGNNIIYARNLIQQDKLGGSEVPGYSSRNNFMLHEYVDLIGTGVCIQDIMGSIVFDNAEIQDIILEAISTLKERVVARHVGDNKLEIVGYYSEINNRDGEGNKGCFLRVYCEVRNVENANESTRL